MKVGVVIFHKNIYSIFQKRWVDKCLHTIRTQTHQEFTVFEICYGDTPERLWEGSEYLHAPLQNHIYALNFIIDYAFENGCDVVMETNLDDFYSPLRFSLQLQAIEDGYDLVSSDFSHIDENDNKIRTSSFSNLDIKHELHTGHNIIAHPVVCINKKFWEQNKYYGVNELGYEDYVLWRKAISNGAKAIILPDILLYYRLHEKQTGRLNPA